MTHVKWLYLCICIQHTSYLFWIWG